MTKFMKVAALAAAMLCALLWSALPAAAQAPTGLENTHRFAYVRDGSVWKTCVDVFTIQKATAKCWLNAGRLTKDGRFVKIDPTKVTNGEIILIGIPTPVLKAQANVTTPAAPAAGIEEPNTTVKKGETPDTAAQAAGNLALESTNPQPETLAPVQTPPANDPIVRTPEQINPETSQPLGIDDGTSVSSEYESVIAYALIAIFLIALVGSMVLTVHDNRPGAKRKPGVAAIRAKNRLELGLPPVQPKKATPAPSSTFPPKVFYDNWRTKSASQTKAAPSKKTSGRKWRLKKPALPKLSLPKWKLPKLGSKTPAESLHERATRFAQANLPLKDFDAATAPAAAHPKPAEAPKAVVTADALPERPTLQVVARTSEPKPIRFTETFGVKGAYLRSGKDFEFAVPFQFDPGTDELVAFDPNGVPFAWEPKKFARAVAKTPLYQGAFSFIVRNMTTETDKEPWKIFTRDLPGEEKLKLRARRSREPSKMPRLVEAAS